jgi:hypothetical protein
MRSVLQHLFAAPLLLGLVLPATTAVAQQEGRGTGTLGDGFITIGSPAEDRIRLRQIQGNAPLGASLIRSTASLNELQPDPASPNGIRVLPPTFRVAWNSAIPLSLNEGSIWAGRGLSTRVVGGLHGAVGRFSVVLAPEVLYVENQEFDFVQSRELDRSPMLAPWRIGFTSADLPVRFGEQAFTQVGWGESSLAAAVGPLAIGLSAENQWWGPGVRNGLVMSNNAPGIPHLFAATRAPVQTRVGDLETRWLIGGLTESLHFDTVTTNDLRAISAVAATLRPAAAPTLTLGFARAVYAPVESRGDIALRAFDVFIRGNPAGPDEAMVDGDSFEQVTSLFGRWVLPDDRFEAYAEWARSRVPRSFRELLTAPNHAQGYTLGLQWAQPVFGADAVRVQFEVSYLERSATFRSRPVVGHYMSPHVPQGYTHRGQAIGAAIGPGASSQWLALDYLGERWRAGVFGTRIRWDNDAFYAQPNGDRYFAHDVSVLLGARGGLRTRWIEVDAKLGWEHRLNYLFQNPAYTFGRADAVDIDNLVLRFNLSPGVGR